MQKIADLEIYPDNRIVQIYNADLDGEHIEHYVTDQTLSQGFSGFPGSYDFYPLGECTNLRLEVSLAEPQEDIALKPETVRAIMALFPSRGRGIKISNLLRNREHLLQIPGNQYALVFEIKLRSDQEYLSSERYQIHIKGGFTEECCCLTFYPREGFVQPEILRSDVWSISLPRIDGYFPLNPTYPLFLESE